MNSGCLAILLGGRNKIATGVARTGARHTKVLPPSKYAPESVFSLRPNPPYARSSHFICTYIYIFRSVSVAWHLVLSRILNHGVVCVPIT